MSAITAPVEANTRFLIDKSLENLGWILDVKNAKRNVFLEQTKTKKELKLLNGEKPDYVLYAKDECGDDKVIMVIEAKRPGKRLDTALEQGIRYAKALDAPIVFATDGLFCKSYHTKFDRTPILNGEEVDEFLRETLAIKYLSSWEVNTVSPKVQYDRKELIKIFDEANNMLRGDGLRAGIERFGEFANILFLKLISETEQNKSESGKQTAFDDSCHWDIIKQIPKSGRLDYINQVYSKLNSLYKTEIFTPLIIRSEDILKEIMDKLDPLTLTDVDSDVKGDAFEYFLKESAATKNDLGEYFTPRHIVKTMVKLVNPQIGEKIYDPFCGTGGFLIESFRHIWNTMPRNDKTVEMLKKETIFGNEITNTARITKMNMILAGDGHSTIHTKDSLAEPIDGTKEGKGYDVVVTNMPYSQKTKYGNLYDMPSNNGDSICVQHCMKAINSTSDNGRMALVVPEGFLFRKDLSKTRELLLINCDLQSVISLPQGVFLPYTGVKTNIIYATKVNQKLKASQKRKDFWYFDVKSDGYSLDNHRRKLDSGSDLDKYQEYRKLDDDQRQDMLDVGFEIVPFDKVKENSFILVGSRYRETPKGDYRYDSKKLSEVSALLRGISFPKSAQKIRESADTIGVVTTKAAQTTGIIDEHIIFVDKSHEKQDKKLQDGDILISLANSLNLVGRTTYVGKSHEGISFGAFMGAIRPDKHKILPRFLYYLLNSECVKQFFLANAKTTTNISNITFEDLSELLLPIPPIEIQQQIADELNGYQHIISGARVVLENYKPHFKVDPKWKTYKLGDICDVRDGTHDSPQYVNKGYPLLTSKNVRFGNIDFDNVNYINEVDFNNINKRSKVDVGDIIMPMIGTIGNPVIVSTDKPFAIKNVALIKFKNNNIINKYVQLCLSGKHFNDYVMSVKRGNTQSFISLADIRNYNIPTPTLKEQQQIVAQIEAKQAIIEPSKQVIEVFTKEMQDRINEIWGE